MLMRHWLTLSTLALFAPSALAEEDWSLCPAPQPYSAPRLPANLPQGAIRGYADSLESTASRSSESAALNQGRMLLEGNVILETGQERLRADRAEFDRDRGSVLLQGHVEMHTNGMSLFATEGNYNQKSGLGGFQNARYHMREQRGNGQASAIQRPSEHITILDDALYTTCESPNPEWALRTSQLRLDRAKGVGTAKHLRLHLFDTPLFYWPYISFPIDDRRKSGLLFPSFGNSTDRGFEYIQPIYWNIHPQADATITPRHMYRRGQQLKTEWRYLNRWGNYQLNAEQLEDKKLDDKRWLVGFKHTGDIGRGWSSNITTRRVSDRKYIEDLGDQLKFGKSQHLLSTANINYSGESWQHTIGVDRYQTLDPTIPVKSRPHRRKPYMDTKADYYWGQYHFNLNSSFVDYSHTERITGQRIDIYPSLSRSFGSSGWFSTAKLGLRHTRYQLNQLETTRDKTPSRTTPILSLDNGLIFERSLGERYTQTLEPRLYGLYTPARDQSQLPRFNTGSYTFSYAQLFRENRFTGADRQGDAQQISVGLTSRISDDISGEDLFSASIGRAYYLKQREVTLAETESSDAEETRLASDIAANAQLRLAQRWSAGTSLQYNREDDHIERRTYRVRYKDGPNKIANLSYRFVRDNRDIPEPEHLKQSEFSGIWPIGNHWTVVGRWLYDLQEQRTQETFAGIGYQSCCWKVSLVSRRLVEEEIPENSTDNLPVLSTDQQWFIQFTLKGLANVGDDNEQLLKRGILGYED